jgi:acetolactate synthase-1/2/3 large subunit
MTGAEILVRELERQGVTYVAGIPGGAVLPIYDALSKSQTIRHVLARHEQGAGFIAQGIARVTGRPGVCLASSGPGATNLLTAIADAKLDSVPLVALTGQVPRGMIGTDAFQEVDTFGLSLPITKHNFLVQSAAELARVLPLAFRIAASGRPGPVLIDIPKDVQNEIADVGASHGGREDVRNTPAGNVESIAMARTEPPQSPDARALDRAAAMLDAAERPILYIGGGVVIAGAAARAVALAERTESPTVMTLMALGAMPAVHPLSLGMLGMHGARSTNLALDRCDLLVAIGARFDDRAIGKASDFCPRARIVHADIDAAEIGKIKQPDVAIVGDAGAVLRGLIERVRRRDRRHDGKARDRSAWHAEIADLKRKFPLWRPGRDSLRQPYGLVEAVAASVDDSALVATDVGQHQMWVAQAYPHSKPRAWLTSGGLGTMGFGLPAAIGAALAAPDRKVVCFSGDGSLLMNIQELATAAEEQVDVKIVLMNNGALGLVHQQQGLFYGGRSFASKYRARPDFVALAAGFGVPAIDLDRASDPRRALAAALETPGPCLVHASIDAEEKVFPMVPPGAGNLEMIGG